MKTRAYLLSDDPRAPLDRIYVDECSGILEGIGVEVVTAQMTSRNPEAELLSVYDRVTLDAREAEWLCAELSKWVAEQKALLIGGAA